MSDGIHQPYDLWADIFETATAQGRATAAAVQEGVKIGHRDSAGKIAMLIHCYDKALADPQTELPTYLHDAIENLRAK